MSHILDDDTHFLLITDALRVESDLGGGHRGSILGGSVFKGGLRDKRHLRAAGFARTIERISAQEIGITKIAGLLHIGVKQQITAIVNKGLVKGDNYVRHAIRD